MNNCAALAHAPGDTYTERLANTVDALEARIGGPHDTSEPVDAPAERWCSDQDADRRADAEENRRWRSLS